MASINTVENILKDRARAEKLLQYGAKRLDFEVFPKSVDPVQMAKTMAERAGGTFSKDSPFKKFMGGLLLGGGLMAGSAGIGKALDAIGSTVRDFRKDSALEKMVQTSPKLQMLDQERVAMYFDVLWTFAPDMAQNPLTAGSVVYQAMQMDIYGGPPVEIIRTLVEIQERHSKSKKDGKLSGNVQTLLTEAGKKQVPGLFS